jgi:adenylosuccinate synthase
MAVSKVLNSREVEEALEILDKMTPNEVLNIIAIAEEMVGLNTDVNEIIKNVYEVIGAQWGDEGKGKVANYLAKTAVLVIRATGGNNAGHTIVNNGKKYAVHLLPSSIVRDNVVSMIAPGVYVDPAVLIQEMEDMKKGGIAVNPEKFVVSNRAHMILPYHRGLDIVYESLKENKVGTTGRGIGPCAEDKMRRTGLPIGYLLLDKETLKKKIAEALAVANILFKNVEVSVEGVSEERAKQIKDLCHEYDVEEIYELCVTYKEYLSEYLKDTNPIIAKYLGRDDVSVVIEGAQAHALDIDHGDYKYVTSSSPNASGSLSGAGIGPTFVKDVYGIAKAYCSRVGEGPFETELTDNVRKFIRNDQLSDEELNKIGLAIREAGHEYGTTTGRPRRCGWLDLVHLREAAKVNGFTRWCLNHVDTIGKIGLEFGFVDVCIGYMYNGEVITHIPQMNREKCIPIYKTFIGGWDTTGCKSYDELPKEAKEYIEYIEKYTNVPVQFIGIGASDEDIIIK